MIAGRLRECLKILRWGAADLAEELGRREFEVRSWLDGRERAPLAVAAWIEALVKAHRALPPPGPNMPLLNSANKPAEIRLAASAGAQAAPRVGETAITIELSSPAAGRRALYPSRSVQSNGGFKNAPHAF
jgi:hypothetical protein